MYDEDGIMNDYEARVLLPCPLLDGRGGQGENWQHRRKEKGGRHHHRHEQMHKEPVLIMIAMMGWDVLGVLEWGKQ